MKKPKILKKPEYNEHDHKLHARIKSILPTDDDKCSLIITLLGSSANLAEFIAGGDLSELSPKVKYSLALVSSNLMAFMSGNKKCDYMMVETRAEDDLGEQTEERIYRKMKGVIEALYNCIKENDE